MPTRARASADRRAHLYTSRIRAARGERDRLNAVVGYLLSTYYKTPTAERNTWFGRLISLAEEMNERSARRD